MGKKSLSIYPPNAMLNYHELRKDSPEIARKLILNVLRENSGNVSKAASILKIQRKTVQRAREGPLSDKSRKPLRSPKKTPSSLEETILTAAKETGYRYRRLQNYLWNSLHLRVPEYTIKDILKRNQVFQKKVRTVNKRRRPLYDYAHMAPFAEMQLDTKHILDLNALPPKVYQHIKAARLPLYEWNIIDVATRTRFTAYSHELSAHYGKLFITLVLSWLRTHGIRTHIHIQADNGAEFCSGSKRKEEEMNVCLKRFQASFSSITAGKHYKQALVENSHRHDDEQFLSIHPIRCENTPQFIHKAQRWQDTWNAARSHFGIEMNGLTPLDKLRQKHILQPETLLRFPVFLLENLLPFSSSLFSNESYVPHHLPFLTFGGLFWGPFYMGGTVGPEWSYAGICGWRPIRAQKLSQKRSTNPPKPGGYVDFLVFGC